MRNTAWLTLQGPPHGPSGLEDDWRALFPPGARVVALPGWRCPRLVVPADTVLQRWLGSGYYPAFRTGARLYRLLLRARAASGIGSVHLSAMSPGPALSNFLEELLPGASVGGVLIGMPGATRKIVARLTDASGHVVGYLKCAGSALARRTLQHEYRILLELPSGAGPTPLGYGTLGRLDALLLAPVSGKPLRATLPPPRDLSGFTASLSTAMTVPFDRHPWVRDVSHRSRSGVESSFAILSGRDWPVVKQHGDLAPWNVFRTHGGRLTAVDWEYGRSAGFPGVDLAHYLLQVACLCHRWSPQNSREYAIRYLAADGWLRLSVAEAGAVVTLSAYDVFQHAVDNGHGLEDPTQRWRRAVWEARRR